MPFADIGGVSDAAGAHETIRAGVHRLQLCTGLVFEGQKIARAINEVLLELLERDGFDSVGDAVGVAINWQLSNSAPTLRYSHCATDLLVDTDHHQHRLTGRLHP